MKRTKASPRWQRRSGHSGNSLKHPIANTILLSLPERERNIVFAKCQFVELPKHLLVHEMGAPIKFCYFIDDGLASILSVMASGKSVEVGLLGREGFLGLPITAGFTTSPTRAIMQVGGHGLRISAADLKDCLPNCPALEVALKRFSQTLTLQATQVAACNRVHEVDQRLSRWLLMSLDRLDGADVPLTQDSLASMLGTRRASVTVAAGILQKAGLITYRRGELKIDDRLGLEKAACECYQTLRRQNEKWSLEAEKT
ncbi:MAG TPA: Crp/Fnr family transcriptional regulator [Candidatus Acidoferrum sp.]|nr:Crp/Fnr family transcriptional regulator [Candidatus Acidoferrum sp.]